MGVWAPLGSLPWLFPAQLWPLEPSLPSFDHECELVWDRPRWCVAAFWVEERLQMNGESC